MPTPDNPWQTVSSRIIYQSPWFNLYEDKVITPSGNRGTYAYPQSPPFVLVVGYKDEHFVMVRQYRYPLKRIMTEFPGGKIDEGESPLDAAKREFEEETGFTAKHWKELGVLYDPNHATVFLAEELSQTGHDKMAEEGIVEALRITWADIDRMIAASEFTDSKTLACLLLFERHRARA
jgi:ADP-ribose pyrophosphatase